MGGLQEMLNSAQSLIEAKDEEMVKINSQKQTLLEKMQNLEKSLYVI